jgi:hypothetical protein
MILSIDIGLRNLALCCIDAEESNNISSYKIKLWDVYNTLDSDNYLCQSLQKNGKICNKKCLYKYRHNDDNIIYCCKTHFPKHIKISKDNDFKKKAINDYLLQDIAKIVLTKLQNIHDENLEIFSKIKKIIIELQPKINQKMKFTSHIIYGKLVELYMNTDTKITFVRASQKLKAYTGPNLECTLKGSYAKRKWLGIQYAKWFLENKFDIEEKEKWLGTLNCSKADDLCDTLLMAINGFIGIPKKQLKDKKGKCIK